MRSSTRRSARWQLVVAQQAQMQAMQQQLSDMHELMRACALPMALNRTDASPREHRQSQGDWTLECGRNRVNT